MSQAGQLRRHPDQQSSDGPQVPTPIVPIQAMRLVELDEVVLFALSDEDVITHQN